GLRQVELAERLLELPAYPVERRARVGGDHRPDELQREPDRPRLEWCQPWRGAERVAEELLVHAHGPIGQLRVDRVAAAAEVDEVEQREMLLELVRRDVEPLDQVGGVDNRFVALTAAVEKVGEQRLEHGEPLRRHRPRDPFELVLYARLRLGGELLRRAL